jgi:hypothetical protein
VLITQEPRTCISFPSKASEEDSIDYPLDLSEMSVSVQSRRESKSLEKKSIQLSSSDKEEPGEDPTELSFTSKTTPELSLTTKDKPKVVPSPVQLPRKHQNFGLKSPLMQDPFSEII